MSPLEVWWAHHRNTNREGAHLKIPMKQLPLPPPKEPAIIKKTIVKPSPITLNTRWTSETNPEDFGNVPSGFPGLHK